MMAAASASPASSTASVNDSVVDAAAYAAAAASSGGPSPMVASQYHQLNQQIQQLKQQQQQLLQMEEQLGRQNMLVQSTYDEIAGGTGTTFPFGGNPPSYVNLDRVGRDRVERDRLERAVSTPAPALGLIPRGGGAPPEVVMKAVEPAYVPESAAPMHLKRPRPAADDDVASTLQQSSSPTMSSDELVERVAARVMQRVRAEISAGWVEMLSSQRAALDGMLRSIRENN